ncbi:MAG: 5'-nucleotidase C-terminal domain-containing protein, partial [Clostridia bacterium]|nr:5'-nucleotidase C-terminal domain-containing protein [Clostridia bacterium]
SYYDIALSEGYVDLVFEGHTHQRYVMHDRHGVYHLQNGGENKGISHAEVAINYVNDSFSTKSAEFVPTSRYSGLEDDAIVDALLKKYESDIAAAERVVGTNKSYMSSDALCDLAAKLYFEAGVARWGADYDIALGGGFFQARSPYNLPAGEVQYGDLQAIFPFDNQLVLCSVQGKYLSSKFFYTNNSNYHIFYGEYGASIKNSIDQNATYYVIVDSYTSSYAPNHLTEIARYDANVYARDLLAEYFGE